jgi:hypothetical protein
MDGVENTVGRRTRLTIFLVCDLQFKNRATVAVHGLNDSNFTVVVCAFGNRSFVSIGASGRHCFGIRYIDAIQDKGMDLNFAVSPVSDVEEY